jgi:LysM repeat protein
MESKSQDRHVDINPRPYEEFREEAGYPVSKKKRRKKFGLRRLGLSGLPWGWVMAAFCFLGFMAVIFTPGFTRKSDDRRVLSLQTRIGQLESRIAALEEEARRNQKATGTSGLSGEGIGSAGTSAPNADASRPAASGSPSIQNPAEKTGTDRYHEVKAGETLYSISRRYDLSVENLRRINGLAAEAFLHPGQKLRISAP